MNVTKEQADWALRNGWLPERAETLSAYIAQLEGEVMRLTNAIESHRYAVHNCLVCGAADPCDTDDVCSAITDTGIYVTGKTEVK
jgi:hypothetical protein